MRALVRLAMTAMVLALFPAPSAQAQIGEATSAFSSALRKAQRMFTGSKQRRRRAKSRSMIAADGTIIIPPRPTANPRRRPSTRTARAGRAAPAVTPEPPPKRPTSNQAANAVQPKQPPPEPKPDIWTPAQIEKAARACRKTLGGIKADLKPVAPIKKGPCGNAAPYKLASLTGKHRVTFRPAPVLNCKMVAALDTWLRRGLQPLAKKHLGSPIASVSVMSSYSCRNAYGRKKTSLSEHALANALDIGGFITANGQKTMLLADWGPTNVT